MAGDKIINELGRGVSMASGRQRFETLRDGPGKTLFLGLGPDPSVAVDLAQNSQADYLEALEFSAQMPPEWSAAIPPGWGQADPEQSFSTYGRIVFYRPALPLFPSFWEKILARLALEQAGLNLKKNIQRAALKKILRIEAEKSPDRLMIRECAEALAKAGFETVPARASELPRLLKESRPAFALSLNFNGLDRFGRTFHLLREAGLETAVWCVDNPWHQICAFKANFWKKLHIFVVDDSFIPGLEAAGAEKVFHLPLAASASTFSTQGEAPGLQGRLLFVGRSEFPEKAAFFAGCALPEKEGQTAWAMLEKGQRPDFAWWSEQLKLERPWPDHPGSLLRRVGFAAEESSRRWRALCLETAAAKTQLSVIGDAGWHDLLPSLADLRPPVDYYHGLGACYQKAGAAVNITSLLLPRGLTQRHFDVWTAGGFLLSDHSPGLKLFPEELTKPITFKQAQELPELFLGWQSRPREKRDLAEAWRELINTAHGYEHRLAAMLEIMTAKP